MLWCKTLVRKRKKDLKTRLSTLTIPFPHRLIMSTYICTFRFNTTPVWLISRDSPCTICPDQTPAALLLFSFHLTPCWSKTNFPARARLRAATAVFDLASSLHRKEEAIKSNLMKNYTEGIKSPLFLVAHFFAYCYFSLWLQTEETCMTAVHSIMWQCL